MDLSLPFRALLPGVDSDVLTVLAASTKPRTGREIARLARRSQRGTQLVLSRFVDHGLVLMEEAGNSRVYTLNRDHLAAEPFEKLADLRRVLFQRLGDEVFQYWRPQPVHLSVFGSAARGDGDLDSDIDIFLVRPEAVEADEEKWRERVEELADAVFRWTGNHAGIAEVGAEEVERLRRDQPAIVESLRTDAVDIVGVPVRELLRGV